MDNIIWRSIPPQYTDEHGFPIQELKTWVNKMNVQYDDSIEIHHSLTDSFLAFSNHDALALYRLTFPWNYTHSHTASYQSLKNWYTTTYTSVNPELNTRWSYQITYDCQSHSWYTKYQNQYSNTGWLITQMILSWTKMIPTINELLNSEQMTSWRYSYCP